MEWKPAHCTLQRCCQVLVSSPYQQHFPRVSKTKIYLFLLCFFSLFRKTTKESLAESASNITESLMGISRMMSQQVQQSEETVQTLGTAGIWECRGDGSTFGQLCQPGERSRVGECAAMMIKGMASRTPLTAGHKQEISVYFVWSFCFMIMRRKRGQDEVEFLVKANWAHTVPRVSLVLLCATALAQIWGQQRKQKDTSPCTEQGVSAGLSQPGSSWDGWDTRIKCLEPEVTGSVSSASGTVKPRFHPVPWLQLLNHKSSDLSELVIHGAFRSCCLGLFLTVLLGRREL